MVISFGLFIISFVSLHSLLILINDNKY
ncbi:putative holin-like toxin [Aliarcobacter butzleri]